MLDGQGADEFLCGYPKDFQFYVRELINNKPERLRINSLINTNHSTNTALNFKDSLFLRSPKTYKFVASVAKKISNKRPKGIHPDFYAEFKNKDSPFKQFTDLKSALKHEMTNQGLEKLLRFADKSSMAHSVEVRLPFLYHELVEFVFSLPSSYFLQNGWSKAILRTSMSDILPLEITYREDKIGFEAPQDSWMESNLLKEICRDAEQALIKNKFITSDYISKWKILIAYKSLFEKQ
jgi:asparagine synthase (glutamine-hydrolysing)